MNEPVAAPLSSQALELSKFVQLIQSIADVISGFFTILPGEASTPDAVPAPFPILNATEATNSTILGRRQLGATTGLTSVLPANDLVNVIQKIVNLSFSLMKIAQAAFTTGGVIPDVTSVLGGVTPNVPVLSSLLSTLPISRIRRQSVPNILVVSTLTNAVPVQNITPVLTPMVGLANTLANAVKEVPALGGAVSSVPALDAISALGQNNLSSVDPA